MRRFRLDREDTRPHEQVELITYRRSESPERTEAAFVSDVRTLWSAVSTRVRLIGGCVIGTLLLTLAYIWIVPPVYKATAEVLIDPRRRAVFQQEIVQSGMGQSSFGADTFLLDSQVNVMTSQLLLRKVIADLNLLDDPELVESASSSSPLQDFARLILRGPRAASTSGLTLEDRVLKALQEDVEVARVGNTYVLGVTVKSKDPILAADIANRLTDLYIEELANNTRSQINQVEEQLGGRLEELRLAALESQRKVEEYRAQNGLLNAERMTVVEQQLRDLNQQLSVVSTTASAARARWEEVSRLRGQTVERVLASGSLDSPHLDSLRQQYSSLTSREASLSATLASRHPSLQALRDSKATVQADIRREVDRLIARYQVEHDVAAANERAVREQIARLEEQMATSNQASVELRDLERQAASDAAIYEQFLVRSKDAREQVNVPTDVARVITTARPDFTPSWPSPYLLLAVALIVGLGLGVGLALLSKLFAGSPAGPSERPEPRSVLGGAR